MPPDTIRRTTEVAALFYSLIGSGLAVAVKSP